mgnify:CR=1 FL=1
MYIGTQCDLWGRPDGTGHEKISRGKFTRLIFSLIPSLFERHISIGCADLIWDITLDEISALCLFLGRGLLLWQTCTSYLSASVPVVGENETVHDAKMVLYNLGEDTSRGARVRAAGRRQEFGAAAGSMNDLDLHGFDLPFRFFI